VATLHKSARHGAHKADDDLSASWQDSEILIKPFYVFERRKELDGGAVGRGALIHHERRLSVIGREGDDAIEIFGGAWVRIAQD
jgi:hypothetical protein